jgi:hypothetical protein
VSAGTVATNGTGHTPLGELLHRRLPPTPDTPNSVKLQARMAVDAVLRLTTGDKPHGLLMLELVQPGCGLHIVAQVVIGSDPLALVTASNTARMLRKGARVRIDGITLGLRTYGRTQAIELHGAHGLMLLEPPPARHEVQEAQR